VVCLAIFGRSGREEGRPHEVAGRAPSRAISGVALRWTNVLGDVREDEKNGRVYCGRGHLFGALGLIGEDARFAGRFGDPAAAVLGRLDTAQAPLAHGREGGRRNAAAV